MMMRHEEVFSSFYFAKIDGYAGSSPAYDTDIGFGATSTRIATISRLSRSTDNPARIRARTTCSVQPAVQGVSVMQQTAASDKNFDLAGMVADLNSLLRLKTTVIGMKMFASVEGMA